LVDLEHGLKLVDRSFTAAKRLEQNDPQRVPERLEELRFEATQWVIQSIFLFYMTYAVAYFTLVFAYGSTVLIHFCCSFSRSQSAKKNNDRKKSTTLPKAMIASDTR
jgi:hypothetical protein